MRKRTIAAICAMLVGTLMLSGCHGKRSLDAFEMPDTFDTSKHYEITFWAKNDTNKNQTNVYHKAIEDFEKLYPNVTVNMRLYTDYGKIYNDVITNISTNTTPDVCITYPDHIATYTTGANVVVPLDELMEDPQYGLGGSEVLFDSPTKDEIVPQFLKECIVNDHYYALPYMRSTEACYINKDYVEKLGYTIPDVLTWDFVWEVSEAATAKDADGNYLVNGQKVMIPFIYKSTDNMMIQMLEQSGAGYSRDDGTVEIFNDQTTEILQTVASHVKTGAFSSFKVSGYPANFLDAGQCIFAIDSTAGATWMGANAPLSDISEENKVDFETVVMPIPQYNTEDMKMISQGPSVCLFNKEDPGQVMASWLFMQYLLTDDVQTGYAETEGYVPVTSKAQSSEQYLDYLSRSGEDNSTYYPVKIAASRLLIDHVDSTFTTPVFNGSTSLRSAAGELIENTVKSCKRGASIDDAFIEKLYSNVTSLYRLNQISTMNKQGISSEGPLPTASMALIIVLICTWIGIITYILWKKVNAQKH